MIRLFNSYHPIRTVILVVGEALMVSTSFLLGIILSFREDSYLVLNFEHGYLQIVAVTITALLLSHWLDLYEPSFFRGKSELHLRLLQIPGMLALVLAGFELLFPRAVLGRSALLVGLSILTLSMAGWRAGFSWLSQKPFLRERVYVLGAGAQAKRLVRSLKTRQELGFDVVGWTGDIEGVLTRENMAEHLQDVARHKSVHRVIVAMQDRRDTMPIQELLHLRLQTSVHIEEVTTWLERISGQIDVEQLYPSWIIFAKGFRSSETFQLVRRLLDILVGFIGLLLALPLIPFIVLAIKLDSRGTVVYQQKRVGRAGKIFYCYKFRTMRSDAEADIGPTWADDDDPRITKVGKVLRALRLDEIPQLWCVLKGDMAFVGPRPERPEFVEWLSKDIPYYDLRNLVRPGITGWAQIRYKYGNSVEDAKQKLKYDLYYIKNASISLDVLIWFQTVKIVLLRRGSA